MPILHFNGKFKFQLPFFNNRPDNDARDDDAYDLEIGNKELKVKFNEKSADLSSDEVHQRLLCDPTKYFEFEFSNVVVNRITYDDGSSHEEEKEEDPVIGKSVLLKGILVDLAPHLQRGRLFAAEVRVTDILIGKLNKALQSEVQRNIRIKQQENPKDKLFHYSGYFETELYDVFQLTDPNISDRNSRYLKELKENLNLKIYFHLVRYDKYTNYGEVFGYIGPSLKLMNKDLILVSNRPLVLNTSILSSDNGSAIVDDFRIDPNNSGTFPRATFEILEASNLLVLRYIDIIPFVDYEYGSPGGYQYLVNLYDDPKQTKEEKPPTRYELIDVSYNELKNSGGIKILKLPASLNPSHLTVKIKVKKNDVLFELLQEPDWYIVLDKSENNENYECIRMYSNESVNLTGSIFHKCQLHLDKQTLYLKPSDSHEPADSQEDSPRVAWFEKGQVESNKGRFKANIISRNLEKSEKIYDPVTSRRTPENKKYLEGDLPWDRYYGNFLSIELKDSQLQPIAELTTMVRIIHKINDNEISSFKDIKKLFSYYMRYYPWLHIKIEDCNYEQFLDFNNTKGLRGLKPTILTRLILDDNDWFKMPRSRDFPKNGDKIVERL